MKAWLLKLHRWAALVFALPLVAVLGTGLILSFEPWLVVRAIEPNSLTPAKIETLLGQHDPGGQARAISYRSYDGTLTIGYGRGGGKVVDIATGEIRSGPSALADTLGTMRRAHETLLYDLRWLVITSSLAMLVLALLGVLMGWPLISNSLAGWHKAMAWGLLPLIVLSPLTGLMLSYGITFTGPPAAAAAVAGARAAPIGLADAVRIVGNDNDLSSLVWLRPLGGRLAVRLVKDGEFRVYAVTRDGAVAMPRNWPRLWHEGNFAGVWSALMNVVISFATLGLLVTGVWIWLRRQIRRRTRRVPASAPAE
ncbi:MAG: PepSY domain-containing protein [Xanthobacteraceae bacterium]|nr:PepSY domain-containing protein [Xanthobacteraceae bacterium]